MEEALRTSSWSLLGATPPRELTAARLALHFGTQPVAAAAYALLPMQADHSHTNLLWSGERGGFTGRPLPGGHRCFLDIAGLRTGLLAPGGEEVASFQLSGQTLDQAFEQLAGVLRAAGEAVPAEGLKLPDYDLPETAIAVGAPFPTPDAPPLEELARWFGNGAMMVAHVAAQQLGGAEVRGWPHHLDLAALLTLDPGEDAERARSVGVGFSPGDGTYAEPYYYVAPWPYPPADDLPELPPGASWHTEGFTAAVLTGSEVVAAHGPDGQLARVDEALRASVNTCLALLGA